MVNFDKKPIGVFDSGVGGLSVLSELQKLLPNEDFLYFGDSANVPYGEKTKEQLVNFSENILDWFASQNVKMVVMACNTSSAVTLPYFHGKYDFQVLGLIEPISKFLAGQSYTNIGLIATNATVQSNAYKDTILKHSDKDVFQVACPGLVQMVEDDKLHTSEAKELTLKYITPLLEKEVDKIILGCTHYPFLSSIINEIVGKDILLNPAEYLAKEAYEKLVQNSQTVGSCKFYTSHSPEEFVRLGKKLYPSISEAQFLELN